MEMEVHDEKISGGYVAINPKLVFFLFARSLDKSSYVKTKKFHTFSVRF